MMDRLLQKTFDGVDVEVIVIESNSTDGTRAEVLKYADYPGIQLILEDKPFGKNHALRAGLEIAAGDLILFQDADLEYDIDDYDALIEPILKCQASFVMGTRHSRNGRHIRRVRSLRH